MTAAVYLLVYSAAMCIAAPRVLPRMTAGGSAPGAAVAAWIVVLGSVLAAWVGAAAALTLDSIYGSDAPHLLQTCFAVLRSTATGHHGLAMQVGLVTFTVLICALVIGLAVTVGRTLLLGRARSRRHARAARIVGHRIAGIDGLVLDAPQKMAYCLAGRPGTVVITSAAIAALDRQHLDAVLAHEQAHLAGRHHLLLAMTRALAASMPRIKLFGVAQEEVSRLLEMCADDAAVRRHGSATLVTAILALAGAESIPSVALGASTVGVCARVTRLSALDIPADRMRARMQLGLVGLTVLVGPMLTWAALHVLAACGPFTA